MPVFQHFSGKISVVVCSSPQAYTNLRPLEILLLQSPHFLQGEPKLFVVKPCLFFSAVVVAVPAFGLAPQTTAGTASFSSLSDVHETTTTLAADSAKDTKRHPLKGVITAIDSDRSAIMVKHEAIPGVMRAMTMLFRIDEATLKSVQKGQTITAMMSRQADEWWLHDVKVIATPPGK